VPAARAPLRRDLPSCETGTNRLEVENFTFVRLVKYVQQLYHRLILAQIKGPGHLGNESVGTFASANQADSDERHVRREQVPGNQPGGLLKLPLSVRVNLPHPTFVHFAEQSPSANLRLDFHQQRLKQTPLHALGFDGYVGRLDGVRADPSNSLMS